ncbi:torsin-4A-A-like [Latimeria chalumnae]|uniref:Torsin family 4 member A n=1 Tax=Latimeria chalumnae TaxID=7897 RepID=H3ATK6_LATCH|nr:PREDICTED: torsin-4A [Latimeria chalumnae]|eukprot:XP_006001474.1 PREDICTED: torsin-4A [Latimeria chalumnae]
MAESQCSSELPVSSQRLSVLCSPLSAAARIRRRYKLIKKTRLSHDVDEEVTSEEKLTKLVTYRQLSRQSSKDYINRGKYLRPVKDSPKHFTFDIASEKLSPKKPRRMKKHRKSKVLYPDHAKRYLPAKEKSRAKKCLVLLSAIICFQILNAIENLDDNVQKYDLEGLEKTMQREVFGQKVAVDSILDFLNNYLATHIHNKPLVISLNGPSGVGKSHVGRLLAKHFSSVMGDDFVLQYYALHSCPAEENASSCKQELATKITNIVAKAEIEEKIPMLIFDEVEFMHLALLDQLHRYIQANESNEFINSIFILISNLGQGEVTKYILQNASSDLLHQEKKSEELVSIIQSSLNRYHSMWKHAEIVPFILLEKSHIMNCFLDEMISEGFHPDTGHIEKLAGQLNYYSAGDREYSVNGCKQVVAKVNLL